MEQATYRQAQDFEAAKRNSPYYAVADFATFQGETALFVGFREEGFSGSLLSIFGDSNVSFEALTDNRPLITTPRKRARFRQRTFAGKPLPDDVVIHANRVASEIEDDSVMRRQFGK
jgi:hypothetical protein